MLLKHQNPASHPESVARLELQILIGDIHSRRRERDHAINAYWEAVEILDDKSRPKFGDDDSENDGINLRPDPMIVYDVKNKLGSLLDDRGAPGDAVMVLRLFEEALAILDASDDPPEELVGNLENNLGMIFRKRDEFDASEKHYRRALEIFERTRGSDHSSVATILNNLGSLHWAANDMERARDCHIRALAIRTKNLDADNAELGQSSSNLATVYHMLGEVSNASLHYERALRILEKNLPKESDTYDIVAQNYADLLDSDNRSDQATALRQTTKFLLTPMEEKDTQPIPRPLLPKKR